MDRPQSPPRRQRACEPCTRAKARCQFEPSKARQHLCSRCEKLGLQCTAKTTRSLRKPRQIKPLNSRVSSLEQRLESLASSLEAHVSKITGSTDDQPKALAKVLQPDAGIAARTPDSTTSNQHDLHAISTVQTQLQQAVPHRPAAEKPPPLGLTWPQAEEVLSKFRELYMNKFPFVILAPGIDARQLLAEKPFVFRVIMLVAAPLPITRLRKMKRNVLAYVGTHLLVEDDRDLDILQGLILLIAWGDDLKTMYDEQVTSLTYMALGYAHNLGITKVPLSVLRQMGLDNAPEDVIQAKRASMLQRGHSAEEQRAFLGCYCLITLNSNQFGRRNPIKGQYVDLCREALSWTREYPSDQFLDGMVRIVQMSDKISEAYDVTQSFEKSKTYLFMVQPQTEMLRAELEDLMQSLRDSTAMSSDTTPGEVEERSRFMNMYYNYLKVRLLEPATFVKRNDPDEPDDHAAYRLLCLKECLLAMDEFFKSLFELEAIHASYQSINLMGQGSYVMVIASRLLLMRLPGWDLQWARQTVDFSSGLSCMAEKVRQSEVGRAQAAKDFVHRTGVANVTEAEYDEPGSQAETVSKTLWIRDWYERRAKELDTSSSSNLPTGQGSTLQSPALGFWEVANPNGWALRESEGPIWFGGLFGNEAWNFDDVPM